MPHSYWVEMKKVDSPDTVRVPPCSWSRVEIQIPHSAFAGMGGSGVMFSSVVFSQGRVVIVQKFVFFLS